MNYSRPPRTRKKYVNGILLSLTIISMLGCSNEDKLRNVGKDFYSNIDAGKYELAYELLSSEDKSFADLSEFSKKIQELVDDYVYPENMDTNTTYSIAVIPDSILAKTMKSETPFPEGANEYYIFREIRRIPDISTIADDDEGDYFERKKVTAEKLISGNFPTILDSNRYAILIDFGKIQSVYVGAKYWTARDSLENMYSDHKLRASGRERCGKFGHQNFQNRRGRA